MKFLEELATIISIISIVVVVYGTFVATCAFLKAEILRFRKKYNVQRLRLLRADLGTYLLFKGITLIFLFLKETRPNKEEQT